VMNKKQPNGYFKYLLALDCETTGLSFTTADPSIGHQAVAWGLIIADAATLMPIEKKYIEIKWNEASITASMHDPAFGKKAEAIHGLSRSYLEKNGVSEQEAVIEIANLILRYFGPNGVIKCLGHNVHMFDIPFLRAMTMRHGIELMFGSRHYDSNSVGFITTGAFTSDALFDTMGFPTRTSHNALNDAEMALESCRRIKVLWESKISVNAYE